MINRRYALKESRNAPGRSIRNALERSIMITIGITATTAVFAQEPAKASQQTGAAAAPAPAPAATVEEIVDRIQAYYASATDYSASFTQTSAHKLFSGRLQRAYGTVKFKKGGLMRWEYVRPEKKFFIYDGKTLWIYEPEVPQIFSGSADAERLRRALAFVSGEGKIAKEYNVKKLDSTKYGYPKGIVLGLRPKEAGSPYKRIELYVDAKTFRVARSVVVDHEGNRNRLDFSNPKLGNNFSNEEFSFTPPPGVPVIDPTKAQ